MKIFVADGANRDRREYCLQHGIGLLFSPAYYVPPPAGASYIIDNGAFGAWTRGIEWDEGAFYALLHKIGSTGDRPYAVVVPDVVAGGLASLKRSAQHIPLIPDEFPKYLPVQDGMTPAAVKPLIEDVDGVFVGGTVAWKWRTSQLWAEFAHNAGKLCHIGRVGNKRNYSRAYAAGADSVDGSTPMRHNKLHVIPEWRDEVAKQANLLSKEEWMLNVGSAVADSRSFGRRVTWRTENHGRSKEMQLWKGIDCRNRRPLGRGLGDVLGMRGKGRSDVRQPESGRSGRGRPEGRGFLVEK